VAGSNDTVGYSYTGTQAVSTSLRNPSGIYLDKLGNLYVADSSAHRVRMIAVGTGMMKTVAGTGVASCCNDGNLAVYASLNSPADVTVDVSGNVYIADTNNNRIRMVSDSSGIMQTVAGDGTVGSTGDGGSAISAKLNRPYGVAVDVSGNVYIADTFNSRIRMVVASGIISTLSITNLNKPYGVIVNSTGSLYIADTGNYCIKRLVGGTVTTIVGTGSAGSSIDGLSGTVSSIGTVYKLSVDRAGRVYFADYDNNAMFRLTNDSGILKTVASGDIYSGDGGPVSVAKLRSPYGVAVDPIGNVYVSDYFSGTVREILGKRSLFFILNSSSYDYF
jgi:trimeric autotransporter adhesin